MIIEKPGNFKLKISTSDFPKNTWEMVTMKRKDWEWTINFSWFNTSKKDSISNFVKYNKK